MLAVDRTCWRDSITSTAGLSDPRKVLTVKQIGDSTAETASSSASISHAEKLTHLDDDAASVLLKPIDPFFNVQLRHFGSALSRQSDSAAGALTDPYLVTFSGAVVNNQKHSYREELSPYIGYRAFRFIFLSPVDTAARALTRQTLARLRNINGRSTVFVSNFPLT
ncbi:hypothetical protein [Nocardia sp. NBC_00511]|uniref:hypothetical protein n=1 Tax=Nocardia sp. NBC_00511 TaxID=2903591 RepID=UPI002F90CA9D